MNKVFAAETVESGVKKWSQKKLALEPVLYFLLFLQAAGGRAGAGRRLQSRAVSHALSHHTTLSANGNAPWYFATEAFKCH